MCLHWLSLKEILWTVFKQWMDLLLLTLLACSQIKHQTDPFYHQIKGSLIFLESILNRLMVPLLWSYYLELYFNKDTMIFLFFPFLLWYICIGFFSYIIHNLIYVRSFSLLSYFIWYVFITCLDVSHILLFYVTSNFWQFSFYFLLFVLEHIEFTPVIWNKHNLNY